MSLYVITNSTCPACMKFKSRQHPELAKKLSGTLDYRLIDVQNINEISDNNVKSLKYTFYPCLVYSSEDNVYIFNGSVTNDGTAVYSGKGGWEVKDIMKWLCDLNMYGTTVVCYLLNDKIEVEIDNPIMGLMNSV